MAGRILLDIGPSLDANGAVDSGSTRTFYENGTTTLQSIYADADLTTPLANPLACDAAGQFPAIWAPDDHAYTVVWQLSDGTLRSFDNISTLGSGSSIDDHGIAYKVDAIGTRTMLHLDLSACAGFGAANAGTANGDALRAAFAALGTASVPVYGAPGIYPCAGSIKMPATVPVFFGNGMVLDFQGQDGDYDTSLVPAGYCFAIAGSATPLPALALAPIRQPPNTNNICLVQSVAAAGNLTLNGSAVSGGVATMDPQGNIVQFDFSAVTAGNVTLTITGTTPAGEAQIDVVHATATGGNLSQTSNYIWGTVTSIAASAALTGTVTVGVTSNTQQITLSGDVPAAVTRGSIVRLVDQTVLYNGARPYYYLGEDAVVHSVTGRTIRFTSSLRFSNYTTATIVNLMNYAGTTVKNLIVHGRGNGTTQQEVALLAYMCGPASALEECYADLSDYCGIQAAFCNGTTIIDCVGMKLVPGISSYGLAIANSCNIRVVGGQYASCWTAITMSGYDTIYSIVNFNNLADDATGVVVPGGGQNQSAAFDTHGNCLECGYVNCTAYGFVTFCGSKTFYRNCYIRSGSGRGLPNWSIIGSELLTTDHELICNIDYLGGGINSGYGIILDCGGTGSTITANTTGGGNLTVNLKVKYEVQLANSITQVRSIVIRNHGSVNPTTNPIGLDFSDSSFQLRSIDDASVTYVGSFFISNDSAVQNFKFLNLTNVTGDYNADIRGVDTVVGAGLIQNSSTCGSASGDGIKIVNPLSVALSSVVGLGGAAGLINITGTTAGAPIVTLSGISAAAGVYGSTELTVQAGNGVGTGGIATVQGCAFADTGHTNISLGNLLFAAMTQNNVTAGGFSNAAANKGSGTGTIASGNTSVVVTHSSSGVFGTAPTRYAAQQTGATTNACYVTQIDTVTATQMTVHCNTDPGASGLAFRWQVQA